MKKQIVGLMGLAVSMGVISMSTPSYAAEAAAASSAAKIGVIDVSQVLNESPQMAKLSKKFKAEFKPRQDAILKASKKLEQDQSKLKKDASVMSKTELSNLQDNIMIEQRKLRQLKEDYMQDAKIKQNQAMKSVINEIDASVKEVADAGHYDLILQRDKVAFASDKVNITPQVIAKLKSTTK